MYYSHEVHTCIHNSEISLFACRPAATTTVNYLLAHLRTEVSVPARSRASRAPGWDLPRDPPREPVRRGASEVTESSCTGFEEEASLPLGGETSLYACLCSGLWMGVACCSGFLLSLTLTGMTGGLSATECVLRS